ncbi:PREDICTED: kinesin-like protein KIF26B [Priapulus caudatus]|uniref:Kinesin-like protein KIF26B n=1 Tax=Priapulus caudatus TaxID=37621 RepID=A0ABM1FB27_PRICU|nr:PREDICTED: kinesin-like protein KIF26B [Priapulus caudatus]
MEVSKLAGKLDKQELQAMYLQTAIDFIYDSPTITGAEAAREVRRDEQHAGAAQKFSSHHHHHKRKKKQHHPAPEPEPYPFPTNFSELLYKSPPPCPPCLLRPVCRKDPTSGQKVKVLLRICPNLSGHQSDNNAASFMQLDDRKKQVTVYDPSNSHTLPAHRRAASAPKMFAFDSIFSQDDSQSEMCSSSLADVIQSVVNGYDGCLFCYGHARLGKTYTMVGRDESPQTLGIIPCAISWLFKLINEQKQRLGTRFSVRVSAVEVTGRNETLSDLLAEQATSLSENSSGVSPGMYLREDPLCGTQLQNQSELRAPTAEKANYYVDAALAARAKDTEDEGRNSHMLFTLNVYQYRVDKSCKGGVAGGRSRLHMIDLGSCEKQSKLNREDGKCLSLSALGNVINALVNGIKHVPYRDSKLSQLLREALGSVSCRTVMIAHVSASVHNYSESLAIIQLAARIHRMRRKRQQTKCSGRSSSDGSSCEEGRLKSVRPLATLNTLRQGVISSDPDVSSSEQSCDTVIYVGPGGVALSDRELTDNEGPPSIVPIPPKLFPPPPSTLPKPAESRVMATRAADAKQFGPQSGRPVMKPQLTRPERPLAPSASSQLPCRPSIPRASPAAAAASKPDVFARAGAWSKVPFRESRAAAVREQWVDGPREQWVDGPGDAQQSAWPEMSGEGASQGVAGERWIDGPAAIAPAPAAAAVQQKEQWIDGPALEQELEHTKAGRTEQWKDAEEVWLDAAPHNRAPDAPRRAYAASLSVSDTLTDSAASASARGEDADSSDPLSALSAENVKLDTMNEGSSVDASEYGGGGADAYIDDEDDDARSECGDRLGRMKLDVASDSHSIISFGSEQKDRLIDERLAGYEGMAQIGSSVGSLAIRSGTQSGSERSRSESPRPRRLKEKAGGSFDFDRELQEIEKVLATVTLEKQERHIVKAVNGFTRDSSGGRQRSPPLSSRAGSEEKPTQIVSPILSDKSDHDDEPEKSLDELDNDEDIWKKVDEVLSSCEEEADTMRAEAWRLTFDASERESGSGGSTRAGCSKLPESNNNTVVSSKGASDLSLKLTAAKPEQDGVKMSPVRPSALRHPDGASNPNLAKHPSMNEIYGILDAETEKELRSTLNTILPDQNKPKVLPSYTKTVVAHASVSYNHSVSGSPKRDVDKLPMNGSLKSTLDSMQEAKKPQVPDKPATAPKPTVLPKPSVPEKSSPKTSPKPPRSSIPKPSTLPKALDKAENCSRQNTLEKKPSTLERLRTTGRSKSETRAKSSDASPLKISTPSSNSTSFFGLKSSAKQTSKSKLPQTSKSSSSKPEKQQKSEKSKPDKPEKAEKKPEKAEKSRFSLSRKDSKNKPKASNNRVAELNGSRGSVAAAHATDYNSGNDSGVVVVVDKPPSLLSPYSTVTKPRSTSHSSSGHGSDNSSVLSGDAAANSPKHSAMKLRLAKLQAGGASSGYESMLRDSEGSGSSTSAHESANESSGVRSRGVRLFKKKLQGTKRSHSAPSRPILETTIGSICYSDVSKPSTASVRWLDTRLLQKSHDEPLELKVYEMDYMERLQRRRKEDAERREQEMKRQTIAKLKAKQEALKKELADAKGHLMINPSRWSYELHVEESMAPTNPSFIEVLEKETHILEKRVAACKSHIMIVTCFDVTL